MHFTESLYRNPYWPTIPLFQVKSLFIYAGVNHFLMVDPKGHQIAGDILNWIEDRLGNTIYEEFEF